MNARELEDVLIKMFLSCLVIFGILGACVSMALLAVNL